MHSQATLKPPIREAGRGRGDHMAGLGTRAQIRAVLNFGGGAWTFGGLSEGFRVWRGRSGIEAELPTEHWSYLIQL